jgi:prepilin peptidase CpaA
LAPASDRQEAFLRGFPAGRGDRFFIRVRSFFKFQYPAKSGLAMSNGWISLIAPTASIAGMGLLLLAAAHDIIARTVPNSVAALLTLTGLGARIMGNSLLTGLIAAVMVFAIAAVCWRRGWLGGGDVKLMAAATLAVPAGHVLTFIVAMSVAGSILAVLYLAAGRTVRTARARAATGLSGESTTRPTNLLRRAIRAELWRLRRGGPLPYACAIAAGFTFVLF